MTGKTDSLSKAGALPQEAGPKDTRVVFLHHSTGGVIYNGGVNRWLNAYNSSHDTRYTLDAPDFPHNPYPWENYPYDYWNIWVKNAGLQPHQGQETLEILTQKYQVIVFKHCYPVSAVADTGGGGNVSSAEKTLANYQAQYQALKPKLHQFPRTKFIVWTGAALVESATNESQARTAKRFFEWVKSSWDSPGDNIFVWDFFQLETEGGLYLLPKHAAGPQDSHPNGAFATRVAPLFGKRLVDVIEGRGDIGSLTGQ